MSGHILNLGSINIDHVYRVPHLVSPSETLASLSLDSGLGGKGANQSVAIAKAGGRVSHAGRIGKADQWAVELMASLNVDVRHIEAVDEPSGHAIIQVDKAGENAILLHGGANQTFELDDIERLLNGHRQSCLLLQNECNQLAETIELARQMNIRVALNPAPMTDEIKTLPLACLEILIMNEIEARILTGETSVDQMVVTLRAMLPDTKIVLTLGSKGAIMLANNDLTEASCKAINVVDTTAAGDTFVGYFLAGLMDNVKPAQSLQRACQAAAITVSRAGAISAIPDSHELN